jgi:plasmid maintenance system antidote protein VapI
MARRNQTLEVEPSTSRGYALLHHEMERRGLTQSELTVMVDDITRDLGKRTTRAEINHIATGRRRATNLIAVGLQEILGIPVRAWFEKASG